MSIPWTIHIHREAMAAIYRLARSHVVPTRDTIRALSKGPMAKQAVKIEEGVYTLMVAGYPIQIFYHLNEKQRTILIRQIVEKS